jgi:hypothetical protein
MKNLFLTWMLIFSFLIPKAYSEPVNLELIEPTVLETKSLETENDFVTQHNDITLKIGTLEFPAIFLYEDEKTPYQGYLIRFNDFLGIEAFVENINKGCDILYDELLKECKSDLDKCQEACEERVNKLIKEKKDVELKLKLQIEKTNNEIKSKKIWSVVSIVVGAAGGILLIELVK